MSWWLVIITVIPLAGQPTLHKTTLEVGPYHTKKSCELAGYKIEGEYVARTKQSKYGYIMKCESRKQDPFQKLPSLKT